MFTMVNERFVTKFNLWFVMANQRWIMQINEIMINMIDDGYKHMHFFSDESLV